jgi:hypothetical protein
LYGIFLLQKVWRRQGFITVWLKKIPVLLCLGGAVALVFVYSYVYALMFLLSLAAAVSLLYALFRFAAYRDQRRVFLPVFIRPARAFGVVTAGSLRFALVPALAIAAFLVLFVSSASFLPRAPAMLLPSPVDAAETEGFTLDAYARFTQDFWGSEKERELPGLTELIALTWKTLTFPYRQLHGGAEEGFRALQGEKITIPEFRQTESGIIESFSSEYVFDESFIYGIISDTERAQPRALERVLVKQGRFTLLDYAGSSRQKEPLSLMLLILSGILPLAIISMVKGKKLDDWSN